MTDPRDQKPKLILPETEGIPNLEVHRMMKKLETTREPDKVHPETAKQISLHLDALQKLVQEGKVEGMVVCALVTRGALPDSRAMTLFGVPNRNREVACELLNFAHGWIDQCAMEIDCFAPDDDAG